MLISLSLREWRNWQTRTVQVRVPVRAWGFKSPLAHQSDESSIVSRRHVSSSTVTESPAPGRALLLRFDRDNADDCDNADD